MPVYEYQCTACQFEFEREQRISEEPIKKCPKCGKAKAKRLISRTSFVLKGGGWYGDLYGSVKPGSEKKEESASASPPPGSAPAADSAAPSTSGATSEAKPAKKGKSKKAAA